MTTNEDPRLEAWRNKRRAAEAAGVAEARRTGKNYVFLDEGTEVTATPSGHIFYNMYEILPVLAQRR